MTAADWGASGLAWLTGDPAGPPDFSRAAVLARAGQVADRLGAVGIAADAAALLAGRAALRGFTRGGRCSAGGASRLLAAADGWCAITLSRPDDLDAVPALICSDDPGEPWAALTAWAADKPAAEAVARARLLDIPAAVLGETAPAAPTIRRAGPRGPARGPHGALVVDLTSLWAGPLCGRLLAQAGATVVKVESPTRPDGTRAGPSDFFDWVNGGKLSCAVDFDADWAFLAALLGAADVVLEGSRPAALARRGLGPLDVAARPGRVWLQITAHGAHGGTGFGDDTAVAGGLVGFDGTGGPVFCADAIADPLTGIEAAAAVLEALARGGGEVITVALSAVAAGYAALPLHDALVGEHPVAAPQRPRIEATGPALGADNGRVGELVAVPRC